ncbi:hypothetical protein JCM10207_005445 [Rhodosporidiobolus poonsookiae]
MTDSSATEECAVCAQPTTLRCSGCRGASFPAFFCSIEHQKLTWPVHKVLCKSDPEVFSLAPLSSQEETTFRSILALKPGEEKYETFSNALSNLKSSYDVVEEWKNMPEKLSDTSDPFPEPKRSELLARLRFLLMAKDLTCVNSAWSLVSIACNKELTEHASAYSTGPHVFRRHNKFLRLCILFWDLLSKRVPNQIPQLRSIKQRALDAVAADPDSTVVDRLSGPLRSMFLMDPDGSLERVHAALTRMAQNQSR